MNEIIGLTADYYEIQIRDRWVLTEEVDVGLISFKEIQVTTIDKIWQKDCSRLFTRMTNYLILR